MCLESPCKLASPLQKPWNPNPVYVKQDHPSELMHPRAVESLGLEARAKQFKAKTAAKSEAAAPKAKPKAAPKVAAKADDGEAEPKAKPKATPKVGTRMRGKTSE